MLVDNTVRLPMGPCDQFGTPRSFSVSLKGRVWNGAPFTPMDGSVRMPKIPASPRSSTINVKWATSPRVSTASVLEHARKETMPNCRRLHEARADIWAKFELANEALNRNVNVQRDADRVKEQKTIRLDHRRTPRRNWGIHDYRPVAASMTGYQRVHR